MLQSGALSSDNLFSARTLTMIVSPLESVRRERAQWVRRVFCIDTLNARDVRPFAAVVVDLTIFTVASDKWTTLETPDGSNNFCFKAPSFARLKKDRGYSSSRPKKKRKRDKLKRRPLPLVLINDSHLLAEIFYKYRTVASAPDLNFRSSALSPCCAPRWSSYLHIT